MPNLEVLDNVVHQGILLKKGMILSDAHQGLSEVGADLVNRGLARVTDASATHTAAIVTGGNEAMALDSTEQGQTPTAATDEQRKAAAEAAQTPATPEQQAQVEDTAAQESKTVAKKGGVLNKLRGNGPDDPPVVPPNPADVAAAAEQAA